jgi:hypothetical protein
MFPWVMGYHRYMRTRREVIKEAERTVAMLYSINNQMLRGPLSDEDRDSSSVLLIRLDALNWVIGPDAVTL